MTAELQRREPDAVHERLKAAIEVPTEQYLWTPANMITFVPALVPIIYGDGRALFAISTLNQRPRYWVIRGDSGWASGGDTNSPWPEIEPHDFIECLDDIIPDMECALGKARCGYCGTGLSSYAEDGPLEAHETLPCGKTDCDGAEDIEAGCAWPAIDDSGGCCWSRMKWPDGFDVVEHPWSWQGNLLVETAHAV